MIRNSVALCLVLLILTSFGSAQAPDLGKLADSVDRHYNSLKSLQANFLEVYKGGGLSRSETGVVWMKKPGKMRWEYATPRHKLFVTDGSRAWFYVPGEQRARRASVKKLDDFRSPLRYMLGRTKLQKEFSGLAFSNEHPVTAGNVVLHGIPKGMEDRVSRVLLEITPSNSIGRILIEELDGSQTEFRFSNEKTNVAVGDERFKFNPPAGVEIMEANELQP